MPWLDGITHESFHCNFKGGLRTGPQLWHELPEVRPPGPRTPRLKQPGTFSTPELLTRALAERPDSLFTRQGQSPPSLRLKPLPLTPHKERLLQHHSLDTNAKVPSLRISFRKQMLRKYRSTLGCWRILDPAGHGRCSYANLCQAAQKLGFINNCRPLWEALDSDRDGFVSLEDFDPQLAKTLRPFAAAASKTSGSAVAAWQQHFNPGGQARVSALEFEVAAQSIGFTGDVAAVYAGLSEGGHCGGVRGTDFALLDLWFKPALPGSWRFSGPTTGVLPPVLVEDPQPRLQRA